MGTVWRLFREDDFDEENGGEWGPWLNRGAGGVTLGPNVGAWLSLDSQEYAHSYGKVVLITEHGANHRGVTPPSMGALPIDDPTFYESPNRPKEPS